MCRFKQELLWILFDKTRLKIRANLVDFQSSYLTRLKYTLQKLQSNLEEKVPLYYKYIK